MQVKCINAGDDCGTGTGLLTEGKIYNVLGNPYNGDGYYSILCDDGIVHTKLKDRFTTDLRSAKRG